MAISFRSPVSIAILAAGSGGAGSRRRSQAAAPSRSISTWHAARIRTMSRRRPAAGGPVYYTAQTTGKLGILDPKTGKYEEIPLGPSSAPHGVIVGPGRRAVDHRRRPECDRARRPEDPRGAGVAARQGCRLRQSQHAHVRRKGRVWFTGQSGYYGRLVPETGDMKVWKAPRGRGPYGIATTPGGDVYYASLAGNHIARIDTEIR